MSTALAAVRRGRGVDDGKHHLGAHEVVGRLPTVIERSEHSFDPFPDVERVVPWGVGCSIVYNYVHLVVRNDTDQNFQLQVEELVKTNFALVVYDLPPATPVMEA